MKDRGISVRIKELLKSKKMTQVELAEKTGFKQSVISEMISGKRNVVPLVEKLVELFGVSRDYIIDGTDNKIHDIIVNCDIGNNVLSKEEQLRLLERLNDLYEQTQMALERISEAQRVATETLNSITAITKALIVGVNGLKSE